MRVGGAGWKPANSEKPASPPNRPRVGDDGVRNHAGREPRTELRAYGVQQVVVKIAGGA